MAEAAGSRGIDEDVIRVPPEEIRFGVILNGGVSLAVWMGGAVLELDRLTKAEGQTGTVYGRILNAAGCRARADVISGTSAGGINGAALALAQVNTLADIGSLRDVWVDQGQLETLLRKPFRGSPTSLLQGDEQFLPALNAALSRLAAPAAVRPADVAPIDLTITATVLRGNQTVAVDSMGQRLPQQVHAARFRWSRDWEKGDPFAAGSILDTARYLALAARGTASFPVAFEPVFVPVGRPGGAGGLDPRVLSEEQRLRPDMVDHVEAWGDELPARDRSRYVVDGGVLANTPTRAALEAVESMDPKGPVRRVMLMVFPHAGAPGADPADDPDEPPSLTGTLAGLLGALTAQGGRTFVEELERHNRAAAGRRGTRQDILDSLVRERRKAPSASPSVDARLETLAAAMLPQYRRLREWRAGRDLARAVLAVVSQDNDGTALSGDFGFERVRRAAENAQKDWERVRGEQPHPDRPGVPYVPDELEDELGLAGSHNPEIWGWGIDGARGVGEAAADLARRLVWVLDQGEDYDQVAAARAGIAATMSALRAERQLVDDVWEAPGSVGRTLTPDESYWTLRLAWYERMMLGVDLPTELEWRIQMVAQHEGGRQEAYDRTTASGEARYEAVYGELRERMLRGEDAPRPGSAGRRVHDRAVELVRTLLPLLPILDRVVTSVPPGLEESIRDLTRWRALFMQEGGRVVEGQDELLRRLLHLEVASSSLGDEVTTGATLPVELVQLSAQTVNGFTQVTRSADDKLGGMSVNRFGGFLKRSWRVNDWTWGRIDAATILCRTVLEPSRLRRAAVIRQETTGTWGARAAATAAVDDLLGTAELRDTLMTDPRVRDTYELAVDEMAEVLDTSRPEARLPASMPHLAELCAWAIHLEIVGEELPVLARAVAADDVDGANARSNGKVLVAEHADLISALTAPPPAATVPVAPPPAATVPVAPMPAGGAEGRAPADLASWYDLRMRALRVFDRAGVGRESLDEEVASDQMIRTATTAAAVATTVVDSDRSGLGRVKAVTRTLRGGMLLPYWVVNALTSRRVIARSLALLGLAVGGVLLALALFGVLPEWLAGPGALLGASALLVVLAYSALRTGTLLHGLLLLTPVAALLAFAVDQAFSPEPLGGAPPGQAETAQDAAAQGTVTLLVVLGLALALMALGSIPASTGSVWAALDALAERRRLRLPRTPRRPEGTGFGARLGWFLRRAGHAILLTGVRLLGLLLGLFALAVPAAVFALVGVVVAWAVYDPWPWLLDFVRENEQAFAVGAGAVVVVGGFLAWWLGRRLRVLRRVGGLPDSDADAWVYKTLAHPAGAAAGWAVLYGLGYLLFAAFLVVDPFSWTDTVWGRALLLTSALLGAVLVAVLPWWLPLRAVRSMERETLERTRTVPLAVPIAEGEQQRGRALQRTLAADLVARGVSYRWLVSPAPDADDVRPRLRRRGRRLARRIDRQRPLA
ncbi:MAG TPA: patatin-like protein [Nocardioidaceae bacterium]|nr:patatin-like protein [Nocardioidaceae bacterium]